ncbi:hypothetical protein ACYX7E_02520 [Luteimonas sp. RIT-PG2_3]
MPTEHALLQRLQSLPPASSSNTDASSSNTAIASCDDLWTCDLLIVAGSSAMSRVGLRMAQTRPSLAFWILDDDGSLHDGRSPMRAVLDNEAMRAVLVGATTDGGTADAVDAIDPPAPVDPADPLAPAAPARTARAPEASATAAPAAAPADDASLAQTPPHPVAVTAIAPGVMSDEAAAPIAGLLRERVANGDGLATLTRDGEALLLLDFDRRLAAPVSGIDKDIASVLATDFHRLRLEPLSARDFNTSASAAQSMPLAPLLWNIALRIDGPVPLLDPMDRRTVLSLRQWPDFRALAHRHDHFRLCCLLLKRPSTTAEAADLLELDAATVDGFFNAAYLSGYAQVSRPVPAAAPAPGPAVTERKRGGSALARMWRSVRQGMQAGS